MIVFQLKCRQDHEFEAWFRDGATCEAQVAAGEVACPQCGAAEVAKAPMAPRLVKSRGDGAEKAALMATQLRQALGELRRQVETRCDHVGERFPEEARKIHYGEVDPRPIYGEATPEQSRALEDEGIEIQRIPWLPNET